VYPTANATRAAAAKTVRQRQEPAMWKSALALTMLITAATTSAAVDLNQATVADLDGIKGIGPAVSSRILDERQKGRFKDWNDFIVRVKGIGAGNAARFASEGLVIDGVAYGSGGSAAPPRPALLAPTSRNPKQ